MSPVEILQDGPSTYDDAMVVHAEFCRAVQGVMLEVGEAQRIDMGMVVEWMGWMPIANELIALERKHLEREPIVTFKLTQQELAALMGGSGALPTGFR